MEQARKLGRQRIVRRVGEEVHVDAGLEPSRDALDPESERRGAVRDHVAADESDEGRARSVRRATRQARLAALRDLRGRVPGRDREHVVGVEVAARSAVRGEQRVELALASPRVMEVRMPHLDRDRKATRQRGEVAVEPRQVACAEVGAKLEQQRPEAIRQQRHALEEQRRLAVAAFQLRVVGHAARELEREAEAAWRLRAPAPHRRLGRQAVEGRVAFDRVEDARVLRQEVLAARIVRVERPAPARKGPDRAAETQTSGDRACRHRRTLA